MKASGTELDLKSNFSTSGWYTAPDPSSTNGFLWFWGQNTGGKRRSLMLVNGKFYINLQSLRNVRHQLRLYLLILGIMS